MFHGIYEASVDAYRRIWFPKSLLRQIEHSEFVISFGMDKCLNMYCTKDWTSIAEKLVELNDLDKESRMLKRLFLGSAHNVELDSVGRFTVPQELLDFASITRDIIFVALGNKIELWSKDVYQNMLSNSMEGYSGMGEMFNQAITAM